MSEVSFNDLLKKASGNVNVEELEEKKKELEKRNNELSEEIKEVQHELSEVKSQLSEPVKEAVKAAEILGIEVPEEYQKLATNNRKRKTGAPRGKFLWQVNGNSAFRGSVSDLTWRHAKDCGGSLKGGVLSTEEFWELAGTSQEEMEPGTEYEVELPNGKNVKFQKAE